MPALLNDASQMQCPHGGQVQAVTSNNTTRGGGGFLLRSSDTFTISGCALNIAGAPHPCVRVQWVQTALKSTTAGAANLNDSSVGLCVAADNAVQGTVLVANTQQKVNGI